MTTYREIIYLDRDNTIDLILKANSIAQSLLSITHMELIISGVTYSSVTPDLFDWAGVTPGYVSISLGHSAVTKGIHIGKLIVYDTSHTSGILWGKIPIKVE